MNTSRLEAFSDGVIAVIITIMVLEMKPPAGATLSDLAALLPIFLIYALSFVFVGIYWVNHHHLFHLVKKVSGALLWANLHLLFWISLVPFSTAWTGGTHFASTAVAAYGVNLLVCAIAYSLVVRAAIASEGKGSKLAKAIGGDFKGNISLGCYILAIPFAFVMPWISIALFVTVALIWLVPDKRIERVID